MRTLSQLVIILLLTVFWNPASAGVLLTKTKVAEVGDIEEKETTLSLKTPYGEASFAKSNLLWYSTEEKVDTLFKAAEKTREANLDQVAILLYELSISREPNTQSQARSELEALRLLNTKVPDFIPANSPETNQPQTSAEKIQRGEELIEKGKALKERYSMDEGIKKENQKLAEKQIAEGEKLIAEGKAVEEAEKATLVAQQEEAQRIAEEQKIQQQTVEATRQERRELLSPVEFTVTDRLVNGCVLVVFGALVMFLLWKFTMSES